MSGYPAAYWNNYSGGNYLTASHWPSVFANIAAKLKDRFPKTWSVMDAGCANGYLVEAFREIGVAAWGIDTSSYAIRHLRPGARGHCLQQSLTKRLVGHYDMVICIEVLEHIPPEDAQLSIANLCAASDNVVFSSSPSDFVEPTHVNVQPQTFWVRAFADQGFERDEDFDGSFIVEWAMRFHRA